MNYQKSLLAVIFGLFPLLVWLSVYPFDSKPISPRWQLVDGSADSLKLQNSSADLLVWPEQLHTDRILEQLKLTKVTDVVKKIYAPHGNFNVPLGREYFRDAQCPVNKCEFVGGFKEADAVIFKDGVYTARTGFSPNQVWILYVLESPNVSGYVGNNEVSVNWTATYREDSDLVTPYEKWVPYTDFKVVDKKNINYAAGKTKNVAWFVSNCAASNERLQYALELQKYIDVDIFGRCGPLKCKRSAKECDEMLDRDYKFYLAFENANCRDYITEKFFVNGLGHNVIPIVMGAHPEDYLRVAPPHSYIHVDDFPSARDLADYLYMLGANDDLYNSYFKWKGTGEFINTKFFCRLCAMLHQNRGPKSYKDFREWWAGENGSVCRKGSWL